MNKLIQGSIEWLEFRKSKIGASDAPIILRSSPWKTPRRLMEEKLGYISPPETTPSMRRGIEMEEFARESFEKETSLIMFPKVIINKKRNWQIASMDGITIEGDIAVEIKCPGKIDHELAKDGKIPEKYHPQLQHQMEVGNLHSIFYYSFDGQKGHIVEMKRDQGFIDHMNEEEEKFYEMMQRKELPDLCEKDYQDMSEISEWENTSNELKYILQEIKKLKEKEDELRKFLINMCDGKSSKGNGIKLTKYLQRGTVDYLKIPELEGINLDMYRKPCIEIWKIS